MPRGIPGLSAASRSGRLCRRSAETNIQRNEENNHAGTVGTNDRVGSAGSAEGRGMVALHSTLVIHAVFTRR
jgi:hypothetical protein